MQAMRTSAARRLRASQSVRDVLMLRKPIAISSSKIVYDVSLKLYFQDVTLSNTGTTAVGGPLFFILEDLPAAVSLVNRSAATACFAQIGSRYVSALAQGSLLAPDTSVVVRLAFSDPSGAAISYTPLVAGSLGGAPLSVNLLRAFLRPSMIVESAYPRPIS